MNHVSDAWEIWPELSRPLDSARRDATRADCLQIWAGLLAREYVLVDHTTTLDSTYVAIARSSSKSRAISPRNQLILEQLCLGDSAKVVAIDAGVSNSTVASVLKRSLETFGLKDTSRVPLALAMLVHSARGNARVTMGRVSGWIRRGVPCEILGATLPSLAPMLPPAVRDVVCMHAQGDSHARIAVRRRTSQRTVANQLATAFSRLGVSGRSGLLVYLSLASARDNAPALNLNGGL
ncbi:MAG: hypothetical protein WDO69_06650 [Pseudomonadota bacterium]